MKNSQKIIVLALCLAILVLATVTVLISHSYFVNNSVLNETVSGRIEGKIPDYTVISMYADGTEIDSMNDVPEGYIIDETNSYCYLSNPEVHDTNVTLHTNSSGEHTFSGLSKGEKCVIYFRNPPQILADFIINNAPKSGTDAVSNSPWILTSDRTGEYRYAGKNPDNYISFNGELWRIIGVMPNMEYCTGTYTDSTCSATATGSLVKIIRNSTEGNIAWSSANTNNWYTASLKTTLQSKTYASDSHVAVVNWSLYGTDSYASAAEGSPAAFYNKERNINSTGAVYSGRPTYWYGRVGLMYPSDYGYATNGGSTYNRTTCLGYQISGWNSGSYKTDCAGNSWLWYKGIEGSHTVSSGTYQWTLSPYSSGAYSVFLVYNNGYVGSNGAINTSYAVRPVLYLSADTIYGGSGTGTYNSPYTIE